MIRPILRIVPALVTALLVSTAPGYADSVNSPNITINVDTNRSTGAGAGNLAVTVNTITIAETTRPEYTSASGSKITLKVRPGFQFDSTSNISALSATTGLNGGAPNIAAVITPSGTADEVITFNLTSGTSSTVQDIIRINGVKLKILSAAGAAGLAQTTISLTTSTAGGAFTDQGIAVANITKGAPDHMVFAIQPSSNQAGATLLPAVQILDFGNNIITDNSLARTISLAIQTNPGGAALLGTTQLPTLAGTAAWDAVNALRINTAASGYVLRAAHSGANFLTSDTIDSQPFDITAGAAGQLTFSTQPTDTVAGGNILLAVTATDSFGNLIPGTNVPVTLSLASNPSDATLLVDTSLTKSTVNGVATWSASDALRITDAGADFTIAASGIGSPSVSSAFDITAGVPNSVRYLQQPSDTEAGVAMSPPVVAEVIDSFGNLTDFSGSLTLTLVVNPCLGNIFGNVASASAGVAEFNNLVIDTACAGYVLKGSAGVGVAWAPSDRFNISPPQFPIAVDTMEIRPGKTGKVKARGSFPLPNRFLHPPTTEGGLLTFAGTTGTAQFSLSARGWKGIGPKKDGSQGFKFKDRQCSKVQVTASAIDVSCKIPKGAFTLPESVVSMVLDVGQGIRYCAVCGGTPSGKPEKTFKRLLCAAPTVCQ